MKKNSMAKYISLFLIAVTPQCAADMEKSKIRHDVWIEAESPSNVNHRHEVKESSGAFGGKTLRIEKSNLPTKKGFEFNYDFEINKDGKYRINIASFPLGISWTSPIKWSVDTGELKKVKTKKEAARSYIPDDNSPKQKMGLFKLGDVMLKKGSHRLNIVIDIPRSTDGKYALQMDAFYLVKRSN
jgi:hypothetical protein